MAYAIQLAVNFVDNKEVDIDGVKLGMLIGVVLPLLRKQDAKPSTRDLFSFELFSDVHHECLPLKWHDFLTELDLFKLLLLNYFQSKGR